MSQLMYRNVFADTYDFKLEDGHCVANCAFDKGWFTVYLIETEKGFENKGECQRLLKALMERAKEEKQEFALWCPMNAQIQHIADKLNIKVYKEENERNN